MAYFAKLDDNNVVIEVHALNNNELLDENGNEVEQKGIDFLIQWSGGYANWKQTSYNGNFRGKYAGIGDTYDEVRNVFISPQPYPSWTLDANANWHPPVAMPADGQMYSWNEANQTWDVIAQNG